jgi:II/X family phage/plasmid replication protein
MMIDWVTCKIPCTHTSVLSGGRVISVSADGSIDFEVNKRLVVEGSHSAKITVRSVDYSNEHESGSTLEISGNPVKFLQGHNVFGTDDFLGLMVDFMDSLSSKLDLHPTDFDRLAWKRGDYQLSRIDINYMYELDNLQQVRTWLRAAEFKARTRQGRPAMKGGTLYFNPQSRRWSMVFYAKGEEIMLPERSTELLERNPKLIEWSQNKLRAELRLRYNELDSLSLLKAKSWGSLDIRDLHQNYMDRLDMADQMTLPSAIEQTLPPRLRLCYTSWLHGENLKETLPTRTYYRYRKQLLEYGIDISLIQEREPDNVVPLIRVLEAKPVEVPIEFKNSSLYFQPRKLVSA